MLIVDESLEVDPILFRIKSLLLESSQEQEIIASMHKVKVTNFKELKIHQRRDLKLLDFKWRVRKLRVPMHFSLNKNGILL